jgi:membrane protease YdiL (CAAX protease family)
MKNAFIVLASLALTVALVEGAILLQVQVPLWPLTAALSSFAVLLFAFVGFTTTAFVRQLRHWALQSALLAFGMPFLLIIPYLVFAVGTKTFSLISLGKLAAYIAVPVALLLPDRIHPAQRLSWRDVAAMAAVALPISAHWMNGIWTWPAGLDLLRSFFCVCVAAYAFIVVRNLEGTGFRLGWRKGDLSDGLANFTFLALVAIPLGIGLNFLHPHASNQASLLQFAIQLSVVYFTIAIPEELLFRGILQNLLAKSLTAKRRSLYALLVTAAVFGLAHLHHQPVPNWRYAILAAVAGFFYGNAFRTRQRLSAAALPHALADTVWHFWF